MITGIPKLYDGDRQIIPVKRPGESEPFGYSLRWTEDDEAGLLNRFPDGVWDAFIVRPEGDKIVANGVSRHESFKAIAAHS